MIQIKTLDVTKHELVLVYRNDPMMGKRMDIVFSDKHFLNIYDIIRGVYQTVEYFRLEPKEVQSFVMENL